MIKIASCKFQETPTSDFESFGGLSPEEGDTPILSLQPITPRFRVKVVEAVKQRTHILFGIETAEVSIYTPLPLLVA